MPVAMVASPYLARYQPGDLLGRSLTIRQGVGSEIVVRPRTVGIGGGAEMVETRAFALDRSA